MLAPRTPLVGAPLDFDISLDFQADTIATELLFSQYTDADPNRMYLAAYADGSVELYVQNAPVVQVTSATGLVTAGRWHTLRATRVGDVFTLYLDGAQVGTQTQSGVSVEQSNTHLGTTSTTLDDFDGKIRNVRIDNAGTVTEYLTEGIGLPGATLTNVTLSSKTYGAIGGRILFQNSDDTANLYEEPMSAEMADIIGRRKYS